MTLSVKDNPVSNFSQGFLYPFRAGKFIKGHPVLFKYIIVPFLINVVVLSIAVYWGLSFFNSIVVHYIPQGDAWYWAILLFPLDIGHTHDNGACLFRFYCHRRCHLLAVQ